MMIYIQISLDSSSKPYLDNLRDYMDFKTLRKALKKANLEGIRPQGDRFSDWYRLSNEAYDKGSVVLDSQDYTIELRRDGFNVTGNFWIDTVKSETFTFSSTASLAAFLNAMYNLKAFEYRDFTQD